MARKHHPMYQADNARSSESVEYDDQNQVDYQNMSAQEFESRRDAQFSDQDSMLDDIHRGVKGLKAHAHAINEEVTVQNEMIDTAANQMDRAQADLEREEAVARLVTEQRKKSCKLYTVVGILTAILVVLFIV